MASAAEASVPTANAPENTLFDLAVENLEFKSKYCSGQEQSGGDGTNIELDKLTILIILFHGVLPNTSDVYPTIDVDSLQNVKNLAYSSLAPAGVPNLGTEIEMQTYREFVRSQMITSLLESLMKLEYKTNTLIFEKRVDTSKEENPSFFSRVCNYCFNIPKNVMSILIAGGIFRTLVTNFNFTGNFSVCKNVLTSFSNKSIKRASSSASKQPSCLHGSVGISKQLPSSRAASTEKKSFKIPTMKFFTMSYDMGILLFNNLRIAIKEFDNTRFRDFCQRLIDLKTFPDLGEAALSSIPQRCRELYVLKGFGMEGIRPFVNKKLTFKPGPIATGGDDDYNMGVIKLTFNITKMGTVNCNITEFTPRQVISKLEPVRVQEHEGTLWFTMKDCIECCTRGDDAATTLYALDMSCSGLGTAIPEMMSDAERGRMPYGVPGGGRGIKKKSGSMKKTRRGSQTKKIKNKSKSSKHIRNRRNRIKPKNRTHKGKQSKRQ